MALFDRFKKSPSGADYYDDENEQVSFFERFSKFNVFVIVALVVVVLIIGITFAVNYDNNALQMFQKSSTKNFESGSFEYNVSASIDGVTYMDYTGQIEVDLNPQQFKSVYHAVYENYEYDAVAYAEGTQAYRGNYYGGKWSIEDYTDRALDFFDFYRDYRKGEFDAGAAVRFTQTNSTFNAEQFKISVDNIINELSKSSNMNDILHAETVNTETGTTVTFTPDMSLLTDVIVDNIGSAYTSANSYNEFKEAVENSRSNLDSAVLVLTYSIDNSGFLTEFCIDYTINGTTYDIVVKMSGFGQAQAQIPEGFYIAAGIEQ